MAYITVDELDAIVGNLYTSLELANSVFPNLSDQDKQVLINRSVSYFETLNFEGYKKDINQVYSFPRYIDGLLIPEDDLNIQNCIAEQVVALANSNGKENTRLQLQLDGVKSITAGKISEFVS